MFCACASACACACVRLCICTDGGGRFIGVETCTIINHLNRYSFLCGNASKSDGQRSYHRLATVLPAGFGIFFVPPDVVTVLYYRITQLRSLSFRPSKDLTERVTFNLANIDFFLFFRKKIIELIN